MSGLRGFIRRIYCVKGDEMSGPEWRVIVVVVVIVIGIGKLVRLFMKR